MTILEPVPFVDLAAIHGPVADELRDAFERVLASGAFIGGEEVAGFETALAARVGTSHAIGVASGTAALHLILAASGIGPGDEVILPANSYVATAEAVVAAGAVPVLVDVDEDTALIDVDAIDDAVTHRTAAIIGVHLYGQPVDADRLRAAARRHGVLFIEDACQAIGATWAGRPAGSLGDAAAFSFYPSKNLGALGDGGAVTTSDAHLARRIALIRNHGEGERYVHQVPGLNERLDGLQAAFLAVKLARLDEDQAERDRAVARYLRCLAGAEGVRLFACHPLARHVHHLLVVRVAHRDAVLERLRSRGVNAQVHYPVPIHLQPACTGLAEKGDLPRVERLAASILSLPLFPRMSDIQVDRCTAELLSAVEANS